jgi:hypothetical protein
VREAGGAVQRRHALVLPVLPRGVRIGARAQQRLGAGQQPVGARAAEEGRVGDVEQRLPAARAERAARRVGAGRQGGADALVVAQHEGRGERLARQAGIERKQRLGVLAARARGPLDQRACAVSARHGTRLGVAYERGPAAGAELARDRQLRVGELRLAVGLRRLGRKHPLARPRVAGARRAQQRLGLAPSAGEIDTPSVHHDHLRRAGGPQHGRR